MRLLDLAMAGMIGVSSIATLILWNPQTADLSSQRYDDEAHLRDFLTAYVVSRGLVSLYQSGPSEICNDILSLSNTTISVSASANSFSCGGSPPLGAARSNITLTTASEDVSIEAWYSVEG